jgi:hypothetical protein
MNLRRVAGWAAVFGLLLTYVIVFERATPHKEEAQGSRAARLFSFTGQEIREVQIASGPRAMRLVRKAGYWETDPSCGHNITPENIESLINALLATTRIDVVAEQQPTHLDQFGLTTPSAQITILLEEKRDPVIVRLGAVAPSQVSMYAQVEHERSVVLIGILLSDAIRAFLYNAGLEQER